MTATISAEHKKIIGIIDYGLGNLGSIKNMLKHLGHNSMITDKVSELDKCDTYILPGVGAFDAGMKRLNESGLTDYIQKVIVPAGKPLLGICLGMQLLGNGSEEGTLPGLGLIDFDTVRFHISDPSLKVPHMGWDIVDIKQDIPLVSDLDDGQRYYFVHSYHAVAKSDINVLMTCEYGYDFAAAVCAGNVIGVQFHPEKSHSFGMALLDNYVRRY